MGPDGVSVELFKITLKGDPALRQRLFDIVVCIWRGARCRSSGNTPSSCYSIKYAFIMVFHRKTDRTECGNYRGISLVAHAG